MALSLHIQFDGNCHDAFEIYEILLDGKIGMMLPFSKPLVYPVVNPLTFRVRLSRQCKPRPAVNGTPFTQGATPQRRLRRTPEGRAEEESNRAHLPR